MARPISEDPLVVTGSAAQPVSKYKPGKSGGSGKSGGGRIRKLKAKNDKLKTQVDALQNPKDPYKTQVGAMADERYGPSLSAAKRQVAAVPGAFDAYRAIVANIATQQRAQYGQAVAGLGVLGGQLANGAAQVVAASRGAQAQGAAVNGATPDQGVLDDAAKAAAVRQGMVGNFGGLVTSQGGAEGAYLGNRQASSAALQLQAQQAANQGVTDLKGQIGAYKTNARNDLVASQAAADAQAAKDRLAMQVLGLNATDKLADNAREDRKVTVSNRNAARERRNRRRINNADNQTTLTTAQIRAAAQAQKEQAKTDKEHKAAERTRRDITNRIRTLAKHTNIVAGSETTTAGIVIPKVVHPTREQVTAQLIKDGFDTVEINQAYKAMKHKRARKKKGSNPKPYTPSDPGGA